MDRAFKTSRPFKVTAEMKQAFEEHGYFVVRNFLDKEELDQIWKTVNEPNSILQHTYQTTESDGRLIRRTSCKHPGNDVTGMVARSEKAVVTCEELLGGEVYHYSSMFILKDANVGGAHLWHQDYGYWYNYGCLYPDMITMWIALDKTTQENSCKQVLRGSHKCGRINHVKLTGNVQYQADPDRVAAIKDLCPLEYLEMEPGDAFFHHCNLLHCSGPNTSDKRRWAFMCCYNKATNNPVGDPHHHPFYTQINKVKDDEIKTCRNYTDFTGKDFANPTKALH